MPTYTQSQIDAMTGEEWAALGGPVATDVSINPLEGLPIGSPNTLAPGVTNNASVTIPLDPLYSTGYEGIAAAVDNIFPSLGKLDSAFGINLAPPAPGSTGSGVQNAANAAVGFWNFASDIPRLATTVVGGLLIVAGLFALSNSSRVIQLAK